MPLARSASLEDTMLYRVSAKTLLTTAAATIGVFAIAVACGPIDNAADCDNACSTYANCYDSDFDVESCRDRCIDKSSGDEDFTKQVNSCDACIQTNDCVENVFECNTECDDVIDD